VGNTPLSTTHPAPDLRSLGALLFRTKLCVPLTMCCPSQTPFRPRLQFAVENLPHSASFQMPGLLFRSRLCDRFRLSFEQVPTGLSLQRTSSCKRNVPQGTARLATFPAAPRVSDYQDSFPLCGKPKNPSKKCSGRTCPPQQRGR